MGNANQTLTRKSKKHYNTEKQITHAIEYYTWLSKKSEMAILYMPYEYDFDGEHALVDMCLIGDNLHTMDNN